MRGVLLALLTVVFCCTSVQGRVKGKRTGVMRMEATAFSQDSQPTASGTVAHVGIVAADPTILPLGSYISISGAGLYDGVYIVTDTGPAIKGRHIDIYLPTNAEARRFGKKEVRVQVLETGDGKLDARDKDIPATEVTRRIAE